MHISCDNKLAYFCSCWPVYCCRSSFQLRVHHIFNSFIPSWYDRMCHATKEGLKSVCRQDWIEVLVLTSLIKCRTYNIMTRWFMNVYTTFVSNSLDYIRRNDEQTTGRKQVRSIPLRNSFSTSVPASRLSFGFFLW